jgi:trk system potassium uptake protein TrkA
MESIIVGCGRVGAAVALLLSEEGHNVTVIDRNPDSFRRLGKTFNGLTLTGNGFDIDTLIKAGASTADAFIVVTDGDNTNIMASQVAKKIFKIPRVIARLYDPKRAEIYQRLGLDILSGTTLVASMIRDKIIESKFSGYLIETKGMGVIEINVSGKFVGKKAAQFNRTDEFLIASIIKKQGSVIPGPSTKLEKGDVIIGIVRTESVKKIKKLFEVED